MQVVDAYSAVLGSSKYQSQAKAAREPREWVEVQGKCPIQINLAP